MPTCSTSSTEDAFASLIEGRFLLDFVSVFVGLLVESHVPVKCNRTKQHLFPQQSALCL